MVDFVTIHCERSTATSKDLPPELLKLGALLSSLPETSPKPDDEGRRLLAAIEECDGNRSQAARILGISRATLYRRLETLGIS